MKTEAEEKATAVETRKQAVVRPGSELARALIEAQAQSIAQTNADASKKAEQVLARELSGGAQDYVLPDGTLLVTDDLQGGRAKVDLERMEKDFPEAYRACVSPGLPFLTMRFKPAMMLLAGSHATKAKKKDV